MKPHIRYTELPKCHCLHHMPTEAAQAVGGTLELAVPLNSPPFFFFNKDVTKAILKIPVSF